MLTLKEQLAFADIEVRQKLSTGISYFERVQLLLTESLDFHDQSSGYSTHSYHAFPAKFPPQLPLKFILELTEPGDIVLDPMAGSGTTIIEAMLTGRKGVGTDIDPLALLICNVKTSAINPISVTLELEKIVHNAKIYIECNKDSILVALSNCFDDKTVEFINYWFSPLVQLELLALSTTINAIQDSAIRAFMQIALSAVIITKSGGVSLARDLAHTRPHKVEGKALKSALTEFEKRASQNINKLYGLASSTGASSVMLANAQELPLRDDSVDLVITSPPYASNAIDYMRAHKFSLIWFGYPITALGEKRREYIGNEALKGVSFETLPHFSMGIVQEVTVYDKNKGSALHRYYSEMTRVLREIQRVLKPGKAAFVVVGTSTMGIVDSKTQDCLVDIGVSLGLLNAGIGIRHLDRDRRMMPTRWHQDKSSQIEKRMNEEYVIGFYKPEVM